MSNSVIWLSHSVVQLPPLTSQKTILSPQKDSPNPFSSLSLPAFLQPGTTDLCFSLCGIYLFWMFCINGIIQFVVFCLWHFKFHIMFSRVIHTLAWMSASSFSELGASHRVGPLQWFIHQCTFVLLTPLTVGNSEAMCVHRLIWGPAFSSLE